MEFDSPRKRNIITILGFIGFLIWLISVIGGGIYFVLSSRQTISPDEIAIVREVWKVDNLLSPTPAPHNVRVVFGDEDSTFWIQPWPFGVVEEVVSKKEIYSIDFVYPLCRKDTLSGNPNDASLAKIVKVKIGYKITDLYRYSTILDHKLFPVVQYSHPLLEVKQDAVRYNVPISYEPDNRKTLLKDVFTVKFYFWMDNSLYHVQSEALQKAYTINYIAKGQGIDKFESYDELDKFVYEFPYLKLSSGLLKTLTYQREFMEMMLEYMETKDRAILEKINKYIDNVLNEDKFWEKDSYMIAREILIKGKESISGEVMRWAVCNLDRFKEIFREGWGEWAEKVFGVKIEEITFSLDEDLAYRYPRFLKKE